MGRIDSSHQGSEDQECNYSDYDGHDHDLHAVSLRHWHASAARLDRREKYAA